MTVSPALAPLQRWFQAAITHPEGVRQGLHSADARAHLDVSADDAERVLTRSTALGALDRLAVYGFAYFARLLDCLREEYPVLKHALGDEAFDAFAAGYLQEHPSRSYTLFDLGKRFPDFLRATRPALDGDDGQPDWADFLIELAELERLFNQVFDGPGVEGQSLLSPEELACLDPEHVLDCRLTAVPCLRLVSLRFPVHRYFTTVRGGGDPIPPDPAETCLAVTRSRYVVQHYELSRPAFALLNDLLAGNTIGAALARAAEQADAGALETSLRDWFADWAAQGFFCAIRHVSSGRPD